MKEKNEYKVWLPRFFAIILLFATTAIVNAKVNKQEKDNRIVASQILQEESDISGNATMGSDPLLSERVILSKLNFIKKLHGKIVKRSHLMKHNHSIQTYFSNNRYLFKPVWFNRIIYYCCLQVSSSDPVYSFLY